MSVTIHCAVAALLLLAGANHTVQEALRNSATVVPRLIAPYVPGKQAGGGGGGDHSLLPASLGRLPRIAPRQFTPPSVVLHNLEQKLPMEPTVAISADVRLPQVDLAVLGDPWGKPGPSSNGPGGGGGMGSGCCGSVGPGNGPGVGPGDGGTGIGIRGFGGDFTAPVVIFKIEPEFSEDARKAKLQGLVMLSAEVDTNGRLRNIRVTRGLGFGLDEKAVEAVKQWRFRPGYRNGKPVVAPAVIEVSFHLL